MNLCCLLKCLHSYGVTELTNMKFMYKKKRRKLSSNLHVHFLKMKITCIVICMILCVKVYKDSLLLS